MPLRSVRVEQPGLSFTVKAVQTLDQLLQVWASVAPILDLPTGEHTLTYYTEQVAKTPRLLVFAECGGRICGCILASSKDEHILVGPVAVAEDSRRSEIGRAMMQEIGKQLVNSLC
jgi:hypothetical protein